MTVSDDDLLDDDDELVFESPESHPDITRAAEALVSESEVPTIQDPLDGPVTLPGGFVRVQMKDGEAVREEVRTAWVRELTGEDEEIIARAKLRENADEFTRAILECGVTRLGDLTPTKDDFDLLTIGDRDFLLMSISRATYGDELEYDDLRCYHCGEELSFVVHISEDIPVKRLDSVAETVFDVRLKNNRVARVRLPDSAVGALVVDAETAAEANTILIAQCVEEIRDGSKVTRIDGDMDLAKKLGVTDRQTLVNEMGEHMPGPQYNGVRFTHEDGKCGKEVRFTVTMADLFRGM